MMIRENGENGLSKEEMHDLLVDRLHMELEKFDNWVLAQDVGIALASSGMYWRYHEIVNKIEAHNILIDEETLSRLLSIDEKELLDFLGGIYLGCKDSQERECDFDSLFEEAIDIYAFAECP